MDVSGSYSPYSFIHQLVNSLGARAVTALIDRVRLVKSPAEQAYLREAATITDIGTQAALDAFAEGTVDYDVAAAALSAMVKAGSAALTCDPYICIGWRTAARGHSPGHHHPAGRRPGR